MYKTTVVATCDGVNMSRPRW